MRITQKLSLALLSTTLFSAAIPAAHAGVSIEYCRQTLDECEGRLSRIQCDIATARSAVDQALANQSTAASNIAAAQNQIDISSRCIANAQTKGQVLNQTLPLLQDRAASAKADYDTTKSRADAAAQQIIEYQTAARTTFESSPAFTQVTADLAQAKQQYDARVAATLDKIRSTDAYADLAKRVDELEDRVKAERNRSPVDQPALEQASRQSMDALNALNRFKADSINNDPDVRAAQAQVNAIEQARQDLITRFNRDMSSDQNLKNLIAASQAAQRDVQAAASTANATAADVSARQQDLVNLQNTINTESTRLAQAQNDRSTWQAALNSYAIDAANAQNDLQALCSREYALRHERDCDSENLRIDLVRVDDDRRQDWNRDHDRDEDRDHDRDRDQDSDHSQYRGYLHDRQPAYRYTRDWGRDRHAVPLDGTPHRANPLTAAEGESPTEASIRRSRDLQEQAQLAVLPPQQRQSADRSLTEERRQRELERQRTQREASVIAEPAKKTSKKEAQKAPSDREAVQRRQLDEARQREQREQHDQQDRQQKASSSRARDDHQSRSSSPPPKSDPPQKKEDKPSRPSDDSNNNRGRDASRSSRPR